MWGIHRIPVNSPHKGQWHGALMFSLICVWINASVNNQDTGDLRCHCAHYDVIVMDWWIQLTKKTPSLTLMGDLWCVLHEFDKSDPNFSILNLNLNSSCISYINVLLCYLGCLITGPYCIILVVKSHKCIESRAVFSCNNSWVCWVFTEALYNAGVHVFSWQPRKHDIWEIFLWPGAAFTNKD